MPVIIKESEPIDYRKVELGIDYVDLHIHDHAQYANSIKKI